MYWRELYSAACEEKATIVIEVVMLWRDNETMGSYLRHLRYRAVNYGRGGPPSYRDGKVVGVKEASSP